MRHRKAGRHLGRDSAHRQALYRNLVTDLLRYERIVTTEAKAKEIRPIAERMVTLGRRGDLHARRTAMKYVYDAKVVSHLFEEIGPRMKERPGGYLRITKAEPRIGDGSAMAVIEFVDFWSDEAPVAGSRSEGAPLAAAAPPRPAAQAAAPAAVAEAPEDAEEAEAVAEASQEEAVALAEETEALAEAEADEEPAAEAASEQDPGEEPAAEREEKE